MIYLQHEQINNYILTT